MSDDIVQLSIKNLLEGQENYSIPMYQRNYAWDEAEITQLIQDVIDYLPEQRNYYIGTLVVFERRDASQINYETIDGQQRLTTLSLLASYLKNETELNIDWYDKLKIQFKSREKSRRTFEAVFSGNFDNDPSDLLKPDQINSGILNGYRLIKKHLTLKLAENGKSLEEFADYLFEMIQIMRVKVPDDTDLNHYFEVMNNRGEQLEKHEILKSRLMEVLEEDKDKDVSQNCLHLVWEACANMERYSQLGFSPKVRSGIYGAKDWGQFEIENFEELCEVIGSKEDDDGVALSISAIIEDTSLEETDDEADETPERFTPVINFPNLLLQVLRVMLEEDIPLDDKRLISTFDDHIIKSDNALELVKEFVFSLLKCKYLLDQYVVKREFAKGTDSWSLKRYKWYDDPKTRSGRGNYVNTFGDDENSRNRRALTLLSAFHVSTPTMVYKHWLNAALYHLFYAEDIQADDYLLFMESAAKSFLFDRFLVQGEGSDYFTIIYKNDCVCQTEYDPVLVKKIDPQLQFGVIENNLIFNYLDYLLWLREKDAGAKVRDYEFTFRSSVEHYYPRNPMPGYDHLESEHLNAFGNLCLISHSKNSRLSNFMPEAKKDYYQNNTLDSIKQNIMMGYNNWTPDEIEEHGEEMKTVLVNSLESEGLVDFGDEDA